MEGLGSGRNSKAVASVKNEMTELTRQVKELVPLMTSLADQFERMGGGSGAGKSLVTNPNPGGRAVANTGPGGAVVGGGGGGTTGGSGKFTFAQPGSPTYMTVPEQPRFIEAASNGPSVAKSIFKGIGSAAMYASMLLPTTNEALRLNLLGDRFRFYGGAGSMAGPESKRLSGGSYGVMDMLAKYGSAIDPMDAAFATNIGAGMGLLPGLQNYNVGQNYSGVLGGAALVSNLVPGAGLQGGVTAMAGLNQARNVNMLRMIGLNVRNNAGTGMRDLPDIINQLYQILKQSAGTDPTPEMIAVSAMSGNALDSLLSQFFGNDDNLRQSVIAALVQLSRTSGQKNIGVAGSKRALIETHGMTKAVASLARRNQSELNLKMATSAATLEGANLANNAINAINDTLVTMATGPGGGAVQAGVATTGFLNTIMGIGGGGIASSIIDDLMLGLSGGNKGSSLGRFLKNSKYGKAAKLGGAVLGVGALLKAFGGMGAHPYEMTPELNDALGFGKNNYPGSPNFSYGLGTNPTLSTMGSVVPSSDANKQGLSVERKNAGGNVYVTVVVPEGLAGKEKAAQDALAKALSAAGVSN